MKCSILVATAAVCAFFFFGCNSGSSSHNNTADKKTDSPTGERLSDVQKSQPLNILFPKGGEELVKGKSYTFKWTGGDSVITIFLVDSSLQSKGASVSLADRVYGLPNNGSYEYTFPDRIQAGTYKVRIGKKESGYFKVVEKAAKQ